MWCYLFLIMAGAVGEGGYRQPQSPKEQQPHVVVACLWIARREGGTVRGRSQGDSARGWPQNLGCVALGKSPHLSVLWRWEGMPASSVSGGMSLDFESAGGVEEDLLHGFVLNWGVALGSILLAGCQFLCLECVNRGEA